MPPYPPPYLQPSASASMMRDYQQQQQVQQPVQPPVPPPVPQEPAHPIHPGHRAPKAGVPVLATVCLALAAFTFGCGGSYMIRPPTDSAEPSAREPLVVTPQGSASSTVRPTEPSSTPVEVFTPQAKYLKATVKDLDRKCYASINMCDVRVKVTAKYSGPPLPENGLWTVSYQLNTGREPELGAFVLKGNGSVTASTTTAKTTLTHELTAKVTRIE